MTWIPFADFYSEAQLRLTNEQLRCLNPYADYFRLDAGGYCGVVSHEGELWISILVGGMRDVWEVRRMFSDLVPAVSFLCRPESHTARIAEYYEAERGETDECYPDGTKALKYTIATKDTKRLKKTV